MGKRKTCDLSTEELRRKMRKLEAEINQRTSRPSTSSPVSCDEDDEEINELEVTEVDPYTSDMEDVGQSEFDHTLQEEPNLPIAEQETEASVTQSVNVPPEILSILGESKTIREKLGTKIPQEMADRWGQIMLNGLGKEAKQELLEKSSIPENFQLVKAPKLNVEVSATLTEASRNRDKRLERSQNQLGMVIARIANLTSVLISGELCKLDIIKQLSEANQVLLDLHCEETLNRRRLIIPSLDKNFWSIVKDVKRDTHLFGQDLGDNIRTSKAIERSSQQIRKPLAHPRAQKQVQGNVREPPRHQGGAGRHAPPASVPQLPASHYYREPQQQPQRPPPVRRPPAASQRGRPAPYPSRGNDRRTRR